MRSVIGWQQTWWQWCGDDRKSSAVCQKKREKDTGSQGNSRRAEDDARSSKKQERGEARREKEWKINRLGEQWEAKKTGHRKKKKELHYLWLSQHCVEVECLGGAPMFGTIIWHGVDPSQEIYAIWLDACIHKCLTLAHVHTFLAWRPSHGEWPSSFAVFFCLFGRCHVFIKGDSKTGAHSNTLYFCVGSISLHMSCLQKRSNKEVRLFIA